MGKARSAGLTFVLGEQARFDAVGDLGSLAAEDYTVLRCHLIVRRWYLSTCKRPRISVYFTRVLTVILHYT